MSRPFKVINCLSQGFAVAGAPEGGGSRVEGVDLEMVVWGMSLDKAIAMADDLNADPKLQHLKD